jgi:hypothetical protein
MQTTVAGPRFLGFVLKSLLPIDDDLDAARDGLIQLAEGNDSALAAIYLEESMQSLVAFSALVEAIHDCHVSVVVLVPSLLHLQALDPSTDVRGVLEQTTGARVLAVQPSQ